MNASPDIAPEVPVAPAAAPVIAPSQLFAWSTRRELWENRSLYMAPLVVAGVVLLGFLINAHALPARIQQIAAMDPAQQAAMLALNYRIAAFGLVATGVLVGIFYCLDALHGERRDRSILFWKSLPVSDTITVLSKAGIALVVLPLIIFVTTVVLQLAMLLIGLAVLAASGGDVALAAQVPLGTMVIQLGYGLVVLSLWHAPLYAWLLLVSGWAKRAMLLWAVLPPAALCVLERMGFGTSYLASLVYDRLFGAFGRAFEFSANANSHVIDAVTPLRFLTSPGLWLGLVAAAALLAAAIRLRRGREPI